MTDALLPLNRTWWFVGNVVDNTVDSTLDRVGDSSTDLLQDVMLSLIHI